ncbi:MAG: SIMPL domain-containing protein, partial [Lachnospiraceae bacterium]|nr:SIMPL domain-containing protein [Lachnospiraceae bacterium]
MKEYKGIIIALIAGICAIICVSILSGNMVSYKKTSGSGGLTATGSANCDFESDLIVWRGGFSAYGRTARE